MAEFWVKSSSPENGRYFADIFRCIFATEKCIIFIQISLQFVPKGPINKQLNDYIRNRATRGDGVKCHDDYPQFPKCFSPDQVHFNKAGKHVYARQLADYYVNFPPLFISDPR